MVKYLLLWCRGCFNGGTAAWGVREELGTDGFQADITPAADFSAACPQKTARHLQTISSLIEHTVRSLEHRRNTLTAMTCPSALNNTSHTLTANPKKEEGFTSVVWGL